MPDITGTHNDGGMAWGSQTVTCKDRSGADATYILEEGSITYGSQVTESMDENGLPNKAFYRQTTPEGSGTLQLASGTSKPPGLFATVDIRPIGGASDGSDDVTFVIQEVGEAKKQDSEMKVSVKFRKQLDA